ncbi:M16 family metallopeptidase [Thermophagus xiamenensis]|uniref:Predicted Zn-dependent peptidase n=1 Tax=Thermophagus xiamenensis TaxID=385682 RepID=A0A1I1XMV5_9BACT|nr:pitrilysin family protein [Thermophagus xiamenensis]SFE08714.1 Predicted Zn-dependent peptidase [Thermophagus xiamenensis]
MPINFKIRPEYKTIEKIDVLPVEFSQLENGVPVSVIRAGSQDVTKIDIEYPAGAVHAPFPLIASTTANLLQEGTAQKTSQQISEIIDFHGAYIHTQTAHHNTVVSLLCLTSHLPQMLELVHEIITLPTFPQHEFDIYLRKRYEEFAIEGEKVKTIASRLFSETIFGADHPYGRQLRHEHFDQIDLNRIKTFHEKYYKPELAKIYVAGQPGDNIIDLLNRFWGEKTDVPKMNYPSIPAPSPSPEKERIIKKENAMQSAIRIGRPLFNNHHSDFIPLQVLNTILGGHFGSRLMTSLREEKGLTYGISSFIMPLKYSGAWIISSEVTGSKREEAIETVFDEFRKLQNELISEKELTMVKNYMMGELLRNFDGPFSTADIYRNLKEYNLDFSFYRHMVNYLRDVTAFHIRELAQKYLNPEEFWVIVAGV